MMKLKTVEFFL
jgi:hypothetical protein